MIKNLGKFKQWTGERFGGAKVTLQTEDFQRLEQETEHRREGYDRILEAVCIVQSHLLKRKTSPEDKNRNNNKVMPFEALGSCLYHYGTVFPDDSALGIALINLGQTETRIAALQEALANDIKTGYMTTLENGLQEYKDYDYLKKKLTTRRLDYDSKLNRLNKAKKEKPELEQEMQASRIKYEDTEHDLIQKMAYIQEFENEHRDALYNLVEAQCNYHSQAKELFESIKSNWGQGSTSDPREMMGNVMARRSSADSYHSLSHQPFTTNNNYTNSSSSTSFVNQHKPSPQSSTDDYSQPNYSTDSVNYTTRPTQQHIPSCTTIASVYEYDKYRKALFDFSSQNVDEISFGAGDVIAVIDEIDKGWWLGEIHGKRGIFPVNYTEEYDPQKHPLPPLPAKTKALPPPVSSVAETTTTALEQQPIEQVHNTNNLEQNNNTSSNANNSEAIGTAPPATGPPPAPPISATSSPSVATIKKTASSSSLGRKKSIAIRPPPPPPATATVSSSSQLHTTTPFVDEPSSYYSPKNTSATSLHREVLQAAAPPPNSRADGAVEDEVGISSTVSSPVLLHHHNTDTPQPKAEHHIPCGECECGEFIENLFKKGYCNNCFHKHE